MEGIPPPMSATLPLMKDLLIFCYCPSAESTVLCPPSHLFAQSPHIPWLCLHWSMCSYIYLHADREVLFSKTDYQYIQSGISSHQIPCSAPLGWCFALASCAFPAVHTTVPVEQQGCSRLPPVISQLSRYLDIFLNSCQGITPPLACSWHHHAYDTVAVIYCISSLPDRL